MTTILVIEDDMDISAEIGAHLESSGYVTDFAYNAKQAKALLDTLLYDMVLLDLNLPFGNGFDICNSLKQGELTKVPVIIISANNDNEDIIRGFESGAWDYVVKPFSLSELAARVKANLARNTRNQHPIVEYQNISLNRSNLSCSYNGKKIQLHTVGFSILETLVIDAPNVVKNAVIINQIWPEYVPNSEPLRAHMYKIRKLIKTEFGIELIYNLKGVGYYIDLE